CRLRRDAEERDCDTDTSQRAASLAQMCGDENHERNAVTPDRTIKCLEMIIKILQPQLSFLRINGRTQATQIFAKLIGCAAEVKRIAIHIRCGARLQLSLDRKERGFRIIFRPPGWIDPLIRFIFRCRDDQQSTSVHETSEKRT